MNLCHLVMNKVYYYKYYMGNDQYIGLGSDKITDASMKVLQVKSQVYSNIFATRQILYSHFVPEP